MTANADNGRLALLLSGGHALRAFQAGACEALEDGGSRPVWGPVTPTGAVNGAIICGNDPELRVERLRQFWTEVSGPDWTAVAEMPLPQTPLGIMAGLRSV